MRPAAGFSVRTGVRTADWWFVAICITVLVLESAAQAQDDKDNPAPTNWWAFSSQSATDIGTTLQNLQSQTSQQVRISDVQFNSSSPFPFTVTYVQNTASYGKQWWWYPQIDDAGLSKNLTVNNARLISFRAYDVGGGNVRYMAVMISNTGADGKSWWWGAGLTPDAIKDLLQQRNARLTSLQSYEVAGQTLYAVIMIANTGADKRDWWYYVNTSPQSIGQALTTNRAYLVDLTPAGNGNFNAVMEGCSATCPNQQWYFGQSGGQISAEAQQNGDRIVTAETYPGCGSYCFAAVMNHGSAGSQHGSLAIRLPDDKVNPAPTNWWVSSGSAAAIGAFLQRLQSETVKQVRISDVQFNNSAVNPFTATYVQNTDSYAKQWWWYPEIDDAGLSKTLTANNARLTSLRAYDVGGGNIRYMAVMISNTGADAKEWWWGAGLSPDAIKDLLQKRNARLTSLQSYKVNGQTLYAVIMIANTGTDRRAWWYYGDTAPQSIGQALTSNKAHLLDLTPAGKGNFNAVMEDCSGPCPDQQWYFGQNPDQVLTKAKQNNARIVTAGSYPPGCGSYCFATVMTQGSLGEDHGSLGPTPTWYAGSMPFDLAWITNSDGTNFPSSNGSMPGSGVDSNGFPLNPRWLAQIKDPTDPKNNPDFRRACGNGWESCSSQNPQGDGYTGDWGSLGVCNQPDTVWPGHLNFRNVTYTGKLIYEDYSSTSKCGVNFDIVDCGQDHDLNFGLTREDYSGMTTSHETYSIENGWAESSGPALHLEFNGDETSWFGSAWWQNFRQWAESDNPRKGFGTVEGVPAIVTGLLGIDAVHNGGYTELHPVFSMALHDATDDPDVWASNRAGQQHVDQHWHFFIMNWGEEGTCSHLPHSWKGLTNYKIQLPWAITPGGVSAVKVNVIAGEAYNYYSEGSYSITHPSYEVHEGKWVILNFYMPPVNSGWDGSITLQYSFPPGVNREAQMRAATNPRPKSIPHADKEIDWSQVLPRITDPAAKRRLPLAFARPAPAPVPTNRSALTILPKSQ